MWQYKKYQLSGQLCPDTSELVYNFFRDKELEGNEIVRKSSNGTRFIVYFPDRTKTQFVQICGETHNLNAYRCTTRDSATQLIQLVLDKYNEYAHSSVALISTTIDYFERDLKLPVSISLRKFYQEHCDDSRFSLRKVRDGSVETIKIQLSSPFTYSHYLLRPSGILSQWVTGHELDLYTDDVTMEVVRMCAQVAGEQSPSCTVKLEGRFQNLAIK